MFFLHSVIGLEPIAGRRLDVEFRLRQNTLPESKLLHHGSGNVG
jgi:hypothetical protein